MELFDALLEMFGENIVQAYLKMMCGDIDESKLAKKFNITKKLIYCISGVLFLTFLVGLVLIASSVTIAGIICTSVSGVIIFAHIILACILKRRYKKK